MLRKIVKAMSCLSTYQMIAMTFVGLIAAGTLLLMLPLSSAAGHSLSFVDALFTATSASCVTGLIVVDTGTYFSTFGQLVLILLIQLGGLGVMTFATLFTIAMGRRLNLQDRLRMQESLNEAEISGVVRLCLKVAKYTFGIELLFGTLMAIYFFTIFGWRGIYYGYWHAVSAFCNAGFDLFGDFRSLTGFSEDVVVNLLITTLIILGSMGFAVLEDVRTKRSFRTLRLQTKLALVTTGILLFGGTLGFYILEGANAHTMAGFSEGSKLMASYFQSVTARTAGFNTIDLGSMRDVSLFFMIILMFIGATPGSTGGGVKTTTVAVLVLAVRQFVAGKKELAVFNRSIDSETVTRAIMIITMGVLWVVFATLLVSYFEEERFLNVLYEVVSAFATVGCSAAQTHRLCAASKLVIILSMFMGRVGVLTFVLSLARTKKVNKIRYPEEHIMIG